jgi:hypothetical protein
VAGPDVFHVARRLGRRPVCVCLLLQDLVQSCLHGGGGEGGIWEDMCYERRRAEASVD